MTTQEITAEQSESTTVNKQLRLWLIVFTITAIISVISGIAGNQSIFSNAGMILAAAMVVLSVNKRMKLTEVENA
jgi:hypothetical protein